MPEQRPLISVIIPVYNVEKYLRQCLDSVAGQTYDNLEIICIDDGSTDSSGVILDEYGTKDQRFKIIHQKNRGISAVRNRGIDESFGEWISFIDGDDIVETHFYEKLLSKQQKDKDIIISCGVILFDSSKNKKLQEKAGCFYEFADILKNLKKCYVCNKIWSRKFIVENNLRFNEAICYCEDVLFSICAATCAKAWQIINYNGYFYRQNRQSISHNIEKELLRKNNSYQVIRQALDFAQKQNMQSKNEKVLEDFLVRQVIKPKDLLDSKYYKQLQSLMPHNKKLLKKYWTVLFIKKIKVCCRFILSSKTFGKNKKYLLFGSIPVFFTKLQKFDGYNNVWTRKIYRECPQVGERLWCGGKTLLTKNTFLGTHCCFNGCEIHGAGKVTIGNHFHSGVGLLIIAQNHNYDHGQHIPYSPDDYIYKDIKIGNFVWIGSRVTILPGTKIGDGAIIQAGAVVHGEIPPLAIAGGNPAKVFKYRDKAHFEKLKDEKSFN